MPCRTLRVKSLCYKNRSRSVIPSEARNLSFFYFFNLNRREIPRFAQNDRASSFSALCEARTACAKHRLPWHRLQPVEFRPCKAQTPQAEAYATKPRPLIIFAEPTNSLAEGRAECAFKFAHSISGR
jgi:hypothetical protein